MIKYITHTRILSIIILITIIQSCSQSINKKNLNGKELFVYDYSSTPVRSIGAHTYDNQVLELKFTFSNDSVRIMTNSLLHSISLPEAFINNVKKSFIDISYKYKFENDILTILEGDIPPTKLIFEEDHIILDDGTTLYNSSLADLADNQKRIDRLTKITALNESEVKKMLKNIITN